MTLNKIRAVAPAERATLNQMTDRTESGRPRHGAEESRAAKRDSVEISPEARAAAKAMNAGQPELEKSTKNGHSGRAQEIKNGGAESPAPTPTTTGANISSKIGVDVQFSERIGLSFGGKG